MSGQKKVGMVSLGCSKNQVDAEMMMALIQDGGYTICANPAECQVVIVNTCGFIEDAKKESIDAILEFCQMKEEGNLKVVVVTGCLAERYQQELAQEIPEADVVLGIGKNSEIVAAIKAALLGERVVDFAAKANLPMNGRRLLANLPYFAYLKVADGCDNRCAYCAIPLIRGNFRSRTMEDVVAEAKELAKKGVKEINLIAQDTTRYGQDIYGKYKLADLLTELCKIEEIHWLRVLYCYPDRITDELLQVMAREDKVVKYFDIPLQHASAKVLKSMNRRGDRASLTALMAKIRAMIPKVVLRTTLIAGFPGETAEDFEELCSFIKEVRFERLGCFAYSQEEGTPAAEMPLQVDEEERRHRSQIVMEEQMGIAEQVSQQQIGKTLEVLVEGYDKLTGQYFGRSYMDAPDIDTRTYFTAPTRLNKGDFVWVKIVEAQGYDLLGQQIKAR